MFQEQLISHSLKDKCKKGSFELHFQLNYFQGNTQYNVFLKRENLGKIRADFGPQLPVAYLQLIHKLNSQHYLIGEKKWQLSDDVNHLGLVTGRFTKEAILLRANSIQIFKIIC